MPQLRPFASARESQQMVVTAHHVRYWRCLPSPSRTVNKQADRWMRTSSGASGRPAGAAAAVGACAPGWPRAVTGCGLRCSFGRGCNRRGSSGCCSGNSRERRPWLWMRGLPGCDFGIDRWGRMMKVPVKIRGCSKRLQVVVFVQGHVACGGGSAGAAGGGADVWGTHHTDAAPLPVFAHLARALSSALYVV